MRATRLSLTILAAVLGCALYVLPAHAQATRTWVSGVGDDANPCSRTAPCKTFAGAISKTAINGEINVLDPGGFGALTITKPINIRSDHIEAGVLVSGVNGIVVNVPNATDQVLLEGLDFEGLGSGINGVTVITGGQVIINRCRINHFTANGVNVAGSVAGTSVIVLNSLITNNGTTGVANTGGVSVKGAGGVSNSLSLISTVLSNNANYAAQADGGVNNIGLIRSVLAGVPGRPLSDRSRKHRAPHYRLARDERAGRP